MGFNLGAALGAAAETGVNTYTKLQRQAAEDLVAKKLLKELKEDEMLEAETQRQTALGTPKGGVAAPAMFDKAINYGDGHEAIRNHVATLTPEQQTEVYRKLKGTEVDVSKEAGIDLGKARVYAGENGPMAATEFTPRSHTEAMGAAAEALAGQGYFNAAKKAGDLYKSAREIDYTKGWDKITKQANEWRSNFNTSLEKGGVSGALETMDPVLKKLGINARSSGDKVEILGADGKVGQTFNGVAELEKGFHGAVSSYVANAALSLTGGDPSKVASMMKDLQSAEYAKFKTDEGRANAPLERARIQASINASNASAGASNRSGNEQYRVGDQIVTINKGKGTAIVDGKEMPITALPADIVKNLRPLMQTDEAPQWINEATGEPVAWKNGAFRDMTGQEVAIGPHIQKNDGSQRMSQTHVDTESRTPLFTKAGQAGFFTQDNKRWNGSTDNVLPIKDAKPMSRAAMDAAWRTTYLPNLAKEDKEYSQAQIDAFQARIFESNGWAPPKELQWMKEGVFPEGHVIKDRKGRDMRVGGQPVPKADQDRYFKRFPQDKPRDYKFAGE
jgi:hypothetical protein